MDVNGTRFALLLGCADWAQCTDENGGSLGLPCDPTSPPLESNSPPVDPAVAWDSTRSELTLEPIPFEFVSAPTDRPPQLSDRRGAGADTFGSFYWIDSSARTVLVQSSGTGLTSTFWPGPAAAAPDPPPGAFTVTAPMPQPQGSLLSGAAVTEDNFLVLGVVDAPGLLVFDLQSGGPPAQLPWPAGVDFSPFDMAARPGGGVFVLDRDNGLVWELDRHFHVVTAAIQSPPAEAPGGFTPEQGSPPPQRSPAGRPITAGDATTVGQDALAIEADPNGGFLILEQGGAGGSSVARYAGGAAAGAAVAAAGVAGYDLALTGGQVLVVDADGNQSHAFVLTETGGAPSLEHLVTFYPMREFGGKGLMAAGDQAYYDFDDRWIPLVAQARPRHVEQATIVTPAFDSGIPGCVWHRLMLDARVPQATGVAVWSKAADDKQKLGAAAWLPEPDPQPRRTGCELPFVDEGPYSTHELLLQNPRGRHLMLKLELLGDGRSTPALRALRAWYPRFSYLREYLPRVYRQDPDSASFMDRYLANVEGFYTAIEDKIAAAQVLLGVDTAPADALDWLAGWFALTLDPQWDENRRRVFLRNASRFFQARGTMRGVEIALRFALEPCIDDTIFDSVDPTTPATARIVEAYRTRKTPGVVFGDPTDQGIPRVVVTTPNWMPGQGRDVLQAGWAAFVAQQGLDGPGQYPIADPGGDASTPWSEFSTAAVGFVPVTPDPATWSVFLSRRYPGIAALATAYGLTGAAVPADFAGVPVPTSLPADGAPLLDWFQFESVVIPMANKAHTFTVLLPWPLHVTDSEGLELDNTQLRDLATRVVNLQKPAHTTFAVKFFWAAFRIGDARIGDDTLLASGSRVPELVTQAVLGTDYLGETFLGGPAATDQIRRIASPAPATSDDAEETQ